MHRLRRLIFRLIIVNAVLLLGSIAWYFSFPTGVSLAIAKGKAFYDMAYMADIIVNTEAAASIAQNSPEMQTLLSDNNVGFVNAVPLSAGEARYWQDTGCEGSNCAHAIFYDYSHGGTINAVINLTDDKVVGSWVDELARPAGSSVILDEAYAIAAADNQVTAVLGDIGEADPAMIPMSAWLNDDDCYQDWCVDLTFHAPDSSGRVFHVFVNMEKKTVARTFYTRSRPERSLGKPLSTGAAYTNGCHEQYGWEVCWEMTAYDGINFRDATYNEQPVFSSIKIGQIEAWYPSWPGGYRDQIGFSAAVPPYGNTEINDLGDGFEVRQLFTEFNHWPNCICCYRYAQVIRFFADGALEPRFVSYGPGCDDLSIYRPFWRIDLDMNGPESDFAWVWQENEWVQLTEETEIHPFVDDVAPDNFKIATYDKENKADSMQYRWRMFRTDPLGLDEARFFILADNENEGDRFIATGPGDTYQPPRQWLNGESVAGKDLVFWYIPMLKTKKGGPWWCMPDPEPEFSPCEAILRLEPAGELTQPDPETISAVVATATPAATAIPQPTSTPRPIEGSSAEKTLLNAGCTACHKIGYLGEDHKVGPDLSRIGLIAAERVANMSAEAYIRQSILNPNAFIAPACPNGECLPNIMPGDYSQRLATEQIDQVVAYLLAQKGAPPTPVPATATLSIIGSNETSQPDIRPTLTTKSQPLAKAAPAAPTQKTAVFTTQILLVSIVFLITVFRLLQLPKEDE